MDWEPLGKRRIAVSKTHRFGTDAVLLADFAGPRATERVCDLCTGCGILPLLWSLNAHPPAQVTGLDIQPEAIRLFAASLAEAQLEDRIRAVTGDLREPLALPAASFDRVTCNPPYFAPGSGAVSTDEAVRLARHEGVGCSLADVITAAARLLRWGGAFCLCHRPERLADVMTGLRQAGLEPKRLRLVHKTAESQPWLLLCEAKKGGKPGLAVLPPLVLYEPDGTPTPEHRRIYVNLQEETL